MVTIACTVLFATATVFALGVIATSLHVYGADALALLASRKAPESVRYVSWRIFDTGSVSGEVKALRGQPFAAEPQCLAA